MGYQVKVSECGQFIVIKVVGEMTALSAQSQMTEAHKLGAEVGINRYLVDISESRNIDTISNNYFFVTEGVETFDGINKDARVAIFYDEKDASHEFVERMFEEAGYNVPFFTDIDKAKEFLLKDND